MQTPPTARLLAYGLPALPLAMAALPIYVYAPKLYGEEKGLGLALVGGLLLALRLFDALIDPLLGWWSDRIGQRHWLVAAGLLPLTLGFYGLFDPPVGDVGVLWLGGTLLLVYFGFSLATINLNAWGAELSADVHQRTRIVAGREAFALVGVVLAATLPGVLGDEFAQGIARLAWLFAPLALVTVLVMLRYAPPPIISIRSAEAPFVALRAALRNNAFRRLLAIYTLNGVASAIPATLVLFFVQDVLQLPAQAGLFLSLYFISGVLALPLWLKLSRRLGKVATWRLSMLLAIAVFAWTLVLAAGDVYVFAIICVLSGCALGADLLLPPALLADVIDQDSRDAATAKSGGYFGLWALAAKLSLALAAGLALPLLAGLNYVPGRSGAAGITALQWVYGGLPVALKLLSFFALRRTSAAKAGYLGVLP